MNINNFITRADELITKIADQIENSDPNGNKDIDLNGGILVVNDERGTFIINRQTPAKEVWLSSPISGPYHFFLNDDGKWITKNSVLLRDVLDREFSIQI